MKVFPEPYKVQKLLLTGLTKYNYNGVDFDMEGALIGKEAVVNAMLPKLKKAGLHTQITVFGSSGYSNASQFTNNDTFGLMLYGTTMNGQGWEIPPNASAENPSGSTWGYLKKWIDDPTIPNNKLVLAMTAYTAGGLTSGQIKFYVDLVNKYKLAGILYWPGNANFPSSNCWLKNGFGGDTK